MGLPLRLLVGVSQRGCAASDTLPGVDEGGLAAEGCPAEFEIQQTMYQVRRLLRGKAPCAVMAEGAQDVESTGHGRRLVLAEPCDSRPDARTVQDVPQGFTG